MNETLRTELRRVFLIRDLPAPLTRASRHLQIFDNYIENTRLRLRSTRVPETKEWAYVLEQRFPVNEKKLSVWNVANIHLNEAEHAAFEIFEGREIRKNERVETNEIRKNRYFYNLEEREVEIDVFLGGLWGLNLAKIYFADAEELEKFQPPSFVVAEVTSDKFFLGANLIGKTFADVQTAFQRYLTDVKTPDN